MALVKLRSYRDPVDADLARARLESCGIEAFILDQNLVSIQWLYSDAIGGVKVLVDDSDLQAAQEVLLERYADLPSQPADQAEDFNEDLCPVCGSQAIRPSRVHRNAAAISLMTGLPLVVWRRSWFCAECGNSFKLNASFPSEVPEVTNRADQLVYEKHSYPIARVFLATFLGLCVLYYVQYKIRQPS